MTTGGPPLPYGGVPYGGVPYGGVQPPGRPEWGPPMPAQPASGPAVWGPDPVTDEQLRQLPPPAYPTSSSTPGPAPTSPSGPPPRAERPVAIGLATTLAVTASLLWVSALSLGWLVAAGAGEALQQGGDTGLAFHALDSFSDRMLDGLAVPLYLFPLASLVTGFLLLIRQGWARMLHSVIGVLALAWSAWWLRHSLLEWASLAVYVGVAVGVLWTPAATRWYARRP